MKTIVYPKERLSSYVGDLDLVDVEAEFYSADEKTYRDEKEQKVYRQSNIGAVFPPINTFDDRSVFFKRQYGIRFSYHNYSNRDIIVVDRLNLPVTIEPETRYREGPPVVIIRKELFFDTQEIAFKAYANVVTCNTLHGSEITKLLPHLGKSIQHTLFGRCISLEYIIPFSDIMDADGEVYHIPTDTLISILPIAQTSKHPASPEFVESKVKYPSTYPSTDGDVGIIFRYITDKPNAHYKYVRMGSKVFKLKPQLANPAKTVEVIVKDKVELKEATEYIECLYPTKVDALRPDTKGYRCNRISLNDAKEKYGIFDTIEEANAPVIAVEKMEQRLRDKIEQLEFDLKQQQREHKDKVRQMENDLKSKQADFDELKRANQEKLERQKILNEENSHQRKSSFEFFKFLLGTVASIIAMIPLILKLASAK